MSYAHTKRRKLIAKLKRKSGDWHHNFRKRVEAFLKKREEQYGPPVTLQEIMDARKQ